MINQLVEEGFITPIQISGKNHRSIALFNKYKRLDKKAKMHQSEIEKLLSSYHPRMKLQYYINRKEEYVYDKVYLEAIDYHLKSSDPIWMSVNERSYLLFGDEKWLQKEGQKVLNKIGLKMNDLNCEFEYGTLFLLSMSDLA